MTTIVYIPRIEYGEDSTPMTTIVYIPRIECGEESTPMTTIAVMPKLICAWCSKVLRDAAPGHEEDSVSHGICEECAAKERRNWAER